MEQSKIIQFTSKITPKKIGQFVSIWKRDNNGITVPHDDSDDFDFMIIHSKNDIHEGYFIFPKNILIEQNVISKNRKGGKRGLRVYPPWDATQNRQAIKTQTWQLKYWNKNY